MTARILTGDCRAVLPTLDAGSVHCVVTSPPYFGLRDYGTAQWDGGDPECDHTGIRRLHQADSKQATSGGSVRDPISRDCVKCGAIRQDRQIGLESSLEAYIAELVTVFRLVRRVLRDDGTCWLNLGDSYAGGSSGGDTKSGFNGRYFGKEYAGNKQAETAAQRPIRKDTSLKPKDLMMVPARVALALQADGWWLRSDIIWAKKAPMPESVTDRPTSAHEHVFLLTKKPRYFFEMESVREPTVSTQPAGNKVDMNGGRLTPGGWSLDPAKSIPENGRNLRNVWHLGPQSFAQAHFATFPTTLVEPCIKAGTSEKGCCAACGAPWTRVVEVQRGGPSTIDERQALVNGSMRLAPHLSDHSRSISPTGKTPGSDTRGLPSVQTTTLGWKPQCQCDAGISPCAVLDPFGGAGTVGLVADRLGRNSILIELNEQYAQMARDRISGDCPMFADVVTT